MFLLFYLFLTTCYMYPVRYIDQGEMYPVRYIDRGEDVFG